MAKNTLYMMLGYPGAGKTTTAKVIHKLTGAIHLSSDTLRTSLFPKPKFTPMEHEQLYAELDRLCGQLLADGKDVVYDANLNRYQHRREKYDICKRTGALSVLIWVKTSRELARERAMHDSRRHLWPPGEKPDNMFNRIADIIEPPRAGEPYIKIDGTRVSAKYVAARLDQK